MCATRMVVSSSVLKWSEDVCESSESYRLLDVWSKLPENPAQEILQETILTAGSRSVQSYSEHFSGLRRKSNGRRTKFR